MESEKVTFFVRFEFFFSTRFDDDVEMLRIVVVQMMDLTLEK